MDSLAKLLMLAGGGLLVMGAVVWLVARLGFRGLPGDIRYQGEHASFYFPIVTCLVFSALATLMLWIWQRIGRR